MTTKRHQFRVSMRRDVNGTKMLAHAAYRMGEVAAENAIHGNTTRKANLKYTPAAVYTHPEVAMVGLTEEQAREQYGDVLIGKTALPVMDARLLQMKPMVLSKLLLMPNTTKS